MLKLDHIVVKVKELEPAIARYEAQGFTVTHGGGHPAFGSVNALIPFEDDSYVELIAFPGTMRPDATSSPPGQRVAEWARRSYGPVDWALVPDDIEAEIARLRAAGQRWHDPIPGQRVREDGQVVQWLFGMPENTLLPFLCADVTARELRVPAGAARLHANGATGISQVEVRARDFTQYVTHLEEILGRQAGADTVPGAATIEAGSWHLRVTATDEDSDVPEGLLSFALQTV